jgi:hypothetical protein
MVEAAPERFEELVSEAVDGLRPHLGRMMRTVDIGSLGDTSECPGSALPLRQIDSSERLTLAVAAWSSRSERTTVQPRTVRGSGRFYRGL